MIFQLLKNLKKCVKFIFHKKPQLGKLQGKDAARSETLEFQAVVTTRPRSDVLYEGKRGSAKNGSVQIRARSESPVRCCQKGSRFDEKAGIQFVVRERYVATESKLGQGSYGTVYAGYDSLTDTPLAIKVDTHSDGYLAEEGDVYKKVWNKFPKVRGFPKIYFQGDVDGKEVLIMERLGASIEDHFDAEDECLSLNETLLIGLQALERLERMHESGLIHCDVKPSNMVMGIGEGKYTISLIDMGMARPFRPLGVELTQETSNAATGVGGTLLYAPAKLFRHVELTRRDDLESLAYSLIYLVQGDLPWEALSYNFKNAQKVETAKINFRGSEEFEEMPLALQNFFDIIWDMEHDEIPCYTALREVLEEGLDIVDCENDEEYLQGLVAKTESEVGSFFHTSIEPLLSSMKKYSNWSLSELFTWFD